MNKEKEAGPCVTVTVKQKSLRFGMESPSAPLDLTLNDLKRSRSVSFISLNPHISQSRRVRLYLCGKHYTLQEVIHVRESSNMSFDLE